MRHNFTLLALLLGIILVFLVGTTQGAIPISLHEIISAVNKSFFHPENLTLNEKIFIDIRLPRTLLSLIIGASLAIGGILMQGLFRNPLIEPGLVGTSSGGALGASLFFVFSNSISTVFPIWTLPICAFIGSAAATILTTGINHRSHFQSANTTQLLLTGIAINAICMSLVGIISFFARDPQARSITFWGLGSLASANWKILSICSFTFLVGILLSYSHSKSLDALHLGEKEATLLGIKMNRLRISIILTNVVLIGVATSFVGVISFVGLIIPHILRGFGIQKTKKLITTGALFGGIVLGLSDVLSRTVIAPIELPIGIITALLGAPVFIYLIRTKQDFTS